MTIKETESAIKKCPRCKLMMPADDPYCKSCRILYSLAALLLSATLIFMVLASHKSSREAVYSHTDFIKDSADLPYSDQKTLDRIWKINRDHAKEVNEEMHSIK
jgi:hypothetical protein